MDRRPTSGQGQHRRRARTLGARVLLAASLVPVAAGLAACGGGDDEGQDATAGGQAQKSTAIRVTYNTNAVYLTTMIAKDEGIFEKNGLDVELSVFTDASTVPATLGRQFELGAGNPASLMAAQSQGIDLVAVAGVALDTANSPLVTLVGGRDIKQLADLRGKRIGVPALRGTYFASLVSILDEAGVPPGSYKTTAIPIPRAGDQLRAGVVDAVMVVPPFVGQLVGEGFRDLGDPQIQALTPPVISAFWMAQREWADSNPNAIAAWVRSIEEATRFLDRNSERAREILQKYTDLPADVVKSTTLPVPTATVKSEQIAAWIPVFEDAKQMPDGIDPARLAIPIDVQKPAP